MPFEKGKSGNPAGRPKGVPDRRQLVRDLLLPDAPDLITKAVELALGGDTAMLKACLDKLIPNARPNTEVQFDGSGSIGTQGSAVLGQICDGELGVEDGKSVMDLLAIQAKLEEQDGLVERISALEEAHGVH
jgi:hypothetical protein